MKPDTDFFPISLPSNLLWQVEWCTVAAFGSLFMEKNMSVSPLVFADNQPVSLIGIKFNTASM